MMGSLEDSTIVALVVKPSGRRVQGKPDDAAGRRECDA